MSNIGIAFDIINESKPAPIGWSKESGHMVFGVKMDFTRKARWILDGHRYADPNGSTYVGVVSRDSVCTSLTYSELNGIDMLATNTQNTYLQAPLSQKHYVVCGEEFGLENVGKVSLIRRALYRGKPSGQNFRNYLC